MLAIVRERERNINININIDYRLATVSDLKTVPQKEH